MKRKVTIKINIGFGILFQTAASVYKDTQRESNALRLSIYRKYTLDKPGT